MDHGKNVSRSHHEHMMKLQDERYRDLEDHHRRMMTSKDDTIRRLDLWLWGFIVLLPANIITAIFFIDVAILK